MDSIFSKLNSINVNDKTEKKNGLTYLSWAWAWGEVKKLYPDATYTIYENTLPTGYVVNYFTDGKTSYVKTGVTIDGLEHIEELPVMDYRNKSITLENMTSFDVNKTIQRSLTKACARHGLGLYIFNNAKRGALQFEVHLFWLYSVNYINIFKYNIRYVFHKFIPYFDCISSFISPARYCL